MNEVVTDREIEILEFNAVRESLAALTVSPMARSRASGLLPADDAARVYAWQEETSEGKRLYRKSSFAPAAVGDPCPLVQRSRLRAVLAGTDLAIIAVFIRAVRAWRDFFRESENVALYPRLAGLSAGLFACGELNAALRCSIDEDGNVLDGASGELASLRRRQIALQGRIRERLNDFTRSSSCRRYLQDALVTIRGGRYVLPVKQEYRHSVPGVVHDQSASGATLFIEPLAVVELQNEHTALQRQEEKEVERILASLSQKVAQTAEELEVNCELYGELDLIFARGRLADQWEAREAGLQEKGKDEICLVNALHPLLGVGAVPLSLTLGNQETRGLVLTGPNTGGKTVALKTIGLLVLMAQCGLHLPVGEGTLLPVFKKIRADVGDEQSLAQSLSTFSGHMKNIIAITGEASPGSLVLLDELGAGTDPSEGAALAMAILEELARRGALTVATTHINELKLFAQLRPGMQNAAMEFDLETLEPTYRLLQGIPGQSNAFVIARRLGLPSSVLERARTYLHRSHEQVEGVISKLVADQQRYSRESEKAAEERDRAERLVEELEKERRLLAARRSDFLRQAREEARQLVRNTRARADDLLAELKELQNMEAARARGGMARVRGQLNEMLRETSDGEEDDGVRLDPDSVMPGGKVFVPGLMQEGEVISRSGEEVAVQVGSLRVQVGAGDLAPLRQEKGKTREERERKRRQSSFTTSGGYSLTKNDPVSESIDLRGMNLEEAIPLVDKHLDNALWAGLSGVTIIHGKGTGRLKHGLQDYLRGHHLVLSLRDGREGEGGAGVTMVKMAT